jgi:endonuclease G
VDEVERITGIDFFPALPDDIENKVEASYDLSLWN